MAKAAEVERCPQCGGELVYDEVDIGVGTLRGSPGCPDCHWVRDPVCEHGVALDVHCCNCHSGFLFDAKSCVCDFGPEPRGD